MVKADRPLPANRGEAAGQFIPVNPLGGGERTTHRSAADRLPLPFLHMNARRGDALPQRNELQPVAPGHTPQSDRRPPSPRRPLQDGARPRHQSGCAIKIASDDIRPGR